MMAGWGKALVCALALAGCSRPPPAPPPPLLLGDSASAPRAQLSTTLAATLRATAGGEAHGTVVLAEDAQSLVLGAALDGLPTGDYRLVAFGAGSDATNGRSVGDRNDEVNCALSGVGSPFPEIAFATFDADENEQAKFSQRAAIAQPLSNFVGDTVVVYAGAQSSIEAPQTPIACGVLALIAR